MAANRNPKLKNQKGMATIELIPLMLVFLLLVSYTIGFFGVIHTGILQSIAARTYAFEMYRNRANLTHFRANKPHKLSNFKKIGARTNAILSELVGNNDDKLYATERPIAKGLARPPVQSRQQEDLHAVGLHSSPELDYRKRNTTISVNPVWILVQYGVCLNAKCEPNQ